MTNTTTLRAGDTVRPTNVGADRNGATLDWTTLRGRVIATWTTPGTAGEPVADVEWTRGRYFGARRTNGFPAAMLAKVAR